MWETEKCLKKNREAMTMDRVNKYIRFCLKNIPICIAAIGFNAMSGWFRSLGASFLERITDAVEAGITDGLISLIFIGALLQGSSYILRWLGAITPKYLSAKFGFTLRLELYDKLTHIAYSLYENEQQGNLVSVIRRDTVQPGEAIYAVLSRIISNVFLLVFSVIVMAKTDAVMTALTLAAVEEQLADKSAEFNTLAQRMNNLEKGSHDYEDLEWKLANDPKYQLLEPQGFTTDGKEL